MTKDISDNVKEEAELPFEHEDDIVSGDEMDAIAPTLSAEDEHIFSPSDDDREAPALQTNDVPPPQTAEDKAEAQKLKAQHLSMVIEKLVNYTQAHSGETANASYGRDLKYAVNNARPEDGLKLLEAWLGRFNSGFTMSLHNDYKELQGYAKKIIRLIYPNTETDQKDRHSVEARHDIVIALLDRYIGADSLLVNMYITPYSDNLLKMIDEVSFQPRLQTFYQAKDNQKLVDSLKQFDDKTFDAGDHTTDISPRPAPPIRQISNDVSRQSVRNNTQNIHFEHGNSDELLARMRPARPETKPANISRPSLVPGKSGR